MAAAPLTAAERCPRTRSQLAPCRLCQEVCPTNSIGIGRGSVTIDSQCSGCGGCHAVCPTGALRPRRRSDAALADHALAQPPPVFACAKTAPVSGAVPVRCLARISAAVLLRLGRKGATSVRLVAGDCDRCADLGAVSVALERSVTSYRELCGACGLPALEITEERRPASEQLPAGALSRRELFSALLPPKDPEPGAASDLRVEIRSGPKIMVEHWLARAPVGVPVLEGECDACDLCVRLCPTGALSARRNGAYYLARRTGRCVACGTCESVCAANALKVHRKLGPSDTAPESTELMADLRLAVCRECGAPLPAGRDLCSGCELRRPGGRLVEGRQVNLKTLEGER